MPRAMSTEITRDRSHPDSWLTVFRAFLRLGCTSFGGPVAHLGYFRAEFVARRQWLDEVGLCRHRRALPVPARTGEQSGRHHARYSARRLARRLGRVDRLHPAFGIGAYRLRLWRRRDSATSPRRRGCTVSRSSPSRSSRKRFGAWRAICVPTASGPTMAWRRLLLVLAIPSAVGQIGAIILGGLIGWRFLPRASGGDYAPHRGAASSARPRWLR